MRNVGLVELQYVENKRKRYVLNSVEYDIDDWPLVGKILEIEAEDWSELERVARLVGLDPKSGRNINVSDLYELKGFNSSEYSVLTFERQEKR